MSKQRSGFAQHGVGFVGLAVLRAVNTISPQLPLVGVDIDPKKIETVRDTYGIACCTPDAVGEYIDLPVHSFSVPTPVAEASSVHSMWGYDLTYLEDALHYFGKHVLAHRSGHTTVVIRSTVCPGTTAEVLIPLLESASGKGCGNDFDVVFNPEFLAQRDAYEDALHPPLIAYAASSQRGAEAFCSCLAGFDVPFVELSSFAAAEGLKMCNNVFNAMVISAGNELRHSLAGLGVSQEEAKQVLLLLSQTAFAKTKKLYGLEDLGPFGGACLPKETAAFLAASRAHGLMPRMLEAAITVNEEMRQLAAQNGRRAA